MANKALGRDLRHLLARARPARILERAGGAPAGGAAAQPGPAPAGRPAQELELPLEPTVAAPAPSGQRPTPVAAPPLPRPPVSPAASGVPSGVGFPWFGVLLAGDAAFLVLAGVLAFGEFVARPRSWYLAGAAVLGGAVCGGLAFVLRRQGRGQPGRDPASPGVRVRLRRL